MRFTINREQLLKGLNIAMKAVDPKSALPHLTNVKMSLNNNEDIIRRPHMFRFNLKDEGLYL